MWNAGKEPWHGIDQTNTPLCLLHCTGQPQITMTEEHRKEDETEEPERPANQKALDPRSGSKPTPLWKHRGKRLQESLCTVVTLEGKQAGKTQDG